MSIYFSLAVALVGLLMYGFSTNGKVQEVGRILLFTGCLAFLLEGSPHLVVPLR